MGGNALKTAFTRRFQKDEFLALEKEVINSLKKTFTDVRPTLYYSEKDSFGDMDLLVMNDGKNINIKEYLQETFNPTEIFCNNSVYSFDYKEIQVDFIYVPKRYWESTYNYFSFNDLHNFIGKIARQFGLKWGQFGLKWVGYNDERNKTGEIFLTQDLKEGLEFLGFDYDRYMKGFNNLTEIFEYVRSCKFYNPYYFDFELMNKVNRERDKKRSTYNSFVEYIKEDKNNEELLNRHKFLKDKTFYLGKINDAFPKFYDQYQAIISKAKNAKSMKEKFNGNLVMKFMQSKGINLYNKELGMALHTFQTSFSDLQAYQEFLLNTRESEIMDKFYQIYLHNNK